MQYQQLQPYIEYATQYYNQANILLATPVELLKSKLSLNNQAIPSFLNPPANFIMFLFCMLFFVAKYSNR